MAKDRQEARLNKIKELMQDDAWWEDLAKGAIKEYLEEKDLKRKRELYLGIYALLLAALTVLCLIYTENENLKNIFSILIIILAFYIGFFIATAYKSKLYGALAVGACILILGVGRGEIPIGFLTGKVKTRINQEVPDDTSKVVRDTTHI